jgi:hypothetical protein
MRQSEEYSESRVSVVEVQGKLGNAEEGERPPLETVTRTLVRTVANDTCVCVLCVVCVCVCVCVSNLESVVTSCVLKCPRNPITDQNSIYNHYIHVKIYCYHIS